MIVCIEYGRTALGEFGYCFVIVQKVFIVFARQVLAEVDDNARRGRVYASDLPAYLCRALDGYLHRSWYFRMERVKKGSAFSLSWIVAILVLLLFVISE
mgnify:CR=1 FL=1